jgi:SET domain-containing protein 6
MALLTTAILYCVGSFFILEADGEIPEELVGCAKILMMPLEEFRTTVVTGKKLPSTKLTVEVQKVLRQLLETRLAEYPFTAKVTKEALYARETLSKQK